MGYAVRYSQDPDGDMDRGYSFDGWMSNSNSLYDLLYNAGFLEEFEGDPEKKDDLIDEFERSDYSKKGYDVGQMENGEWNFTCPGLCGFYGEDKENAIDRAKRSGLSFAENQKPYIFEAEWLGSTSTDDGDLIRPLVSSDKWNEVKELIIPPSISKENFDLIGEQTATFIDNYAVQIGGDLYTGGENEGRDEATTVLNPSGVMYSAIMDDAVCEFCRALDGMQIDLRSPDSYAIYDRYSPQQHNFCRCMYIDLYEEKFSADNKNFDGKLHSKFIKENPELKDKYKDVLSMVKDMAYFNFNTRTAYWSEYPGWEKMFMDDIRDKEERMEARFEKQLSKMLWKASQLPEDEEWEWEESGL